MRIGIDTRILASEGNIPFRNYTNQLLQQLSQQYVSNELFVFTIRGNEDLVKDLKNVEIVYVSPAATNLFLLKIWYDLRLTLALKKNKINVLICPNSVCSLTTKVPQILIVQHLDFNKKTTTAAPGSLAFYKKYMGSFLKKAKIIAALSSKTKDEIAGKYHLQPDKIFAIQSNVPAFFKPINWEEREAIKDQYAEGFEYFIFSAGLHPSNNFVSVLKAFSIFKKWQRSGMKLLVIASHDKYLQPELDRLSNYKHRNDVYIQKNLSPFAIADLVSAAYAVIYTPTNASVINPVLEALQSEVPAIATTDQAVKEIAGEGALYVNPAKPEEIAEAMKTIFKDENLRSEMIAMAKQQNEIFHQNKTSVTIAQLIDAAVSQ